MKNETIQCIFEEASAKMTGRLGAFFQNLATGETAGVRIDESFPSASVYKIFTLAELLLQARQGRFSLDDRHPLDTSFKSEGSGLLSLLDDGLNPTLRDYAKLMMTISDNTAADFLFNLVGREAIARDVLRPLGLSRTKCDLSCRDLIAVSYNLPPGLPYGAFEARYAALGRPSLRNAPAYVGGLTENDETSPGDVSRILERFYRGTWVDAEASREALDIMKRCQTNSRIPKLLPPDCHAAHKTGSMLRVANDAGIVYTPSGDFILALFYNGNVASEEEYAANASGRLGDELLAGLARDVCNAFLEGRGDRE